MNPDKRTCHIALYLAPALIIYLALAAQLNFVQDDAYISYRYVANYLNGDGLVYNIGEQVEGITNFGWVIVMSLAGSLGFDYVLVSRLLGFACGGVLLWTTLLIAREIQGEGYRWTAVPAVYIVAVNLSLAYWAAAGLETACFACLAMLALYLFLKRSRLLAAVLVLAVWMRPEGALLAILFVVIEAVLERRFPRYAFRHGLLAFILSLPYVVFKIAYYGSILPNPFYAKTGFDVGQLMHGLQYTGMFLADYGLYALPLRGMDLRGPLCALHHVYRRRRFGGPSVLRDTAGSQCGADRAVSGGCGAAVQAARSYGCRRRLGPCCHGADLVSTEESCVCVPRVGCRPEQ